MDNLPHPPAGDDRPAAGPPRREDDIAAHLVTLLRRSGRFRVWRVIDHALPPDALPQDIRRWDDGLPPEPPRVTS